MIREKAYAKINLALDVVGKRLDGYHDLKMIMMPIELHDILEFELVGSNYFNF
jgi:4-diphosphocytidyl-2-C-methyl-D-erythritol kinase